MRSSFFLKRLTVLTIYTGSDEGLGLGMPSESHSCNVTFLDVVEDKITNQHHRLKTQYRRPEKTVITDTP
jgi:hypothetical protein